MENPFDLIYQKLSVIEKILNSQITKEIKPPLELGIKEFLTIDEAADFVCQSKSSIYKKTMNLIIPHYKVGKKLLFKRSDLIEWIEEYQVKWILRPKVYHLFHSIVYQRFTPKFTTWNEG